MRYGENPLHVVERVKQKIKQLEPGLPQKTLADGRVSKVHIVPFYDRTDIVHETIDTLKEALLEEVHPRQASSSSFFLLHLRSTISVLVDLSAQRRDLLSSSCISRASIPTSCRSRASPSRSATWATWASS
jgi:Cu/Ag efflux pump CusA